MLSADWLATKGALHAFFALYISLHYCAAGSSSAAFILHTSPIILAYKYIYRLTCVNTTCITFYIARTIESCRLADLTTCPVSQIKFPINRTNVPRNRTKRPITGKLMCLLDPFLLLLGNGETQR